MATLALLATTAAVAGQQQVGSEGAPSASSPDAVVQASEVTVSGRVTDGSGNGIQDVRLHLRSAFRYAWWTGTGSGPESSTDSDGNYVLSFDVDDFESFESGYDRLSYIVDVTPADDRYYRWDTTVEIRAAGPTRLDIQLGLGGRVSGSLVDPDGTLVADQEIRLIPDEQAANAGNGDHFVESDESGHFEIGGIPPGRYRLQREDQFWEDQFWEDQFWEDQLWRYDLLSSSGDTSRSRWIYVTVQEGGHQQMGEIEVIPYSYRFGGEFLDDEGSVHERAINAVAGRGILTDTDTDTDCGRGRICPTAAITRSLTAVWLGRALAGWAGPPAITASRFADVDADGTHAFEAAHIDRFADLGITWGCDTSPLRYCPDRVVTRAEMSTFLQRAFDLEIPDDPAGFVDVDSSSVHARSIDALRASGITIGCDSTGSRYCPDQTVTRGEMATFIHRSLVAR